MSIRDLVHDALAVLGKRNLVLAIHDPSFPGEDDEDFGRGTPYGRGGAAFLEFVSDLGFNGIQLGPQGQTSRGDASPYDSSLFSRNALSISVASLAHDDTWHRFVPADRLEAAVSRSFDRNHVPHVATYDIQRDLLDETIRRMRNDRNAWTASSSPGAGAGIEEELAAFRRAQNEWLEPDAIYEVLAQMHGDSAWFRWGNDSGGELDARLLCPHSAAREAARKRRDALKREHAERVAAYEIEQLIAHDQHSRFHALARSGGVRLFADLQVGFSHRDTWRAQPLFLPGYRLGAPPSRTNPDGQPWGFFVFNPAERKKVAEFLGARIEKVFSEFDGIRIDHPQGLVCPWVYRTDDPDPLHAVQHGARLFSAPLRADHPELARFAIARPDQLATGDGVAEHADGWVKDLDEDQVARYAALMQVIVESARGRSLDTRDIACEILSTLPYPLARVISRFGLGRFRVTQKADMNDPNNVYRSENANAPDWVMMGNHDTPPVRQVISVWRKTGDAESRASYLAARLAPARDGEDGKSWFVRKLMGDDRELMHALVADLMLSRAENVSIFFADLFGLDEAYNVPGTVAAENWSLRVPHDYRATYPVRSKSLEAINLPYALALALEAPGTGGRPDRARIAGRLRRVAFGSDS